MAVALVATGSPPQGRAAALRVCTSDDFETRQAMHVAGGSRRNHRTRDLGDVGLSPALAGKLRSRPRQQTVQVRVRRPWYWRKPEHDVLRPGSEAGQRARRILALAELVRRRRPLRHPGLLGGARQPHHALAEYSWPLLRISTVEVDARARGPGCPGLLSARLQTDLGSWTAHRGRPDRLRPDRAGLGNPVRPSRPECSLRDPGQGRRPVEGPYNDRGQPGTADGRDDADTDLRRGIRVLGLGATGAAAATSSATNATVNGKAVAGPVSTQGASCQDSGAPSLLAPSFGHYP